MTNGKSIQRETFPGLRTMLDMQSSLPRCRRMVLDAFPHSGDAVPSFETAWNAPNIREPARIANTIPIIIQTELPALFSVEREAGWIPMIQPEQVAVRLLRGQYQGKIPFPDQDSGKWRRKTFRVTDGKRSALQGEAGLASL